MPTAGELRLEQAHQRDLATISAGVLSGVANIALGADPAAISTWFFTALDAITARVQTGYAQARRSGTGYMQSRATMAGADVDVRAGSLNLAQARTSLEVTGPVAFKRAIAAGADDEEALLSMATQMSGSAQRLAIGGDRDVLEQTIAHGKGVLGYRRVLGGPGCGFCAMLASRGAVYLSRESASTTRSGLQFHDHCVPAGTLVAGPGTEKAFRRWYEGELVVLRAGDNQLSITPNHPVLTPRGWVPAGLLREGDYVVERPRFDRESADVPHEDDVPAPIEDVWRSLRVNGLVQVPVAAEDFHGDGPGTQGDVDVVPANGLLSLVGDAALCHEHAQQVGSWAGPRFVAGSLASFGDADLVLLGALAVADGLVGVGGQGLSLLDGQPTHSEQAGLAAVARLNAGLDEPPNHHAPSHAQAPGDAQNGFAEAMGLDGLGIGGLPLRRRLTEFRPGLNAAVVEGFADGLVIQPDSGRRLLESLSGRVQLRRVVELRRIGSWSGHVYNLQTADGWYSANKIVVHNCRCHVEPMFSHEPDPPDVQRLQRQWQRVTAGHQGQGKAVAWRNYWENEVTDRSKLRLAAAKAGPPSPVPPPPTPAPGVVVRSGLDAKRTLTGLQEAWAAEAKRITGRTLDVNIPAGTSLQTAKEYAEGVLRGLERFPDAALERIRFGQLARNEYAQAGNHQMTFNQRWSNMANRRALVSDMQDDIAGWSQNRDGWSTRGAGTPTALSLHEFAHILDIDNLGESIHSRVLTLAQRRATLQGIGNADDLVARDISIYATSDTHELIAEAFADVMLRGQAASPLSKDIFDLLEAEYFKAGGRITPAFGTFPAKAAPNLARMTVADLRALAAERGVTLPAKALKADIVRALEQAPGQGKPIRVAGVAQGEAALRQTQSVVSAIQRAQLGRGPEVIRAREAIRLKDAVYDRESGYAGGGYRDVNRGLQAARGGPLPDAIRARVEDLDRVVSLGSITDDVVLYRGIARPELLTGGRPLRVGDEFTEYGYSSTSVSLEHADDFARGRSTPLDELGGRPTNPTVVRFVAPKGQQAIQISDLEWPGVGEVLLPRGVSYRVVADRGLAGNVRQLDVEIIPTPAVREPGAARWLGNVDLPPAEAERIGQLVQAKSRRDILDEITQLRADGASNRALANRIRGRAALPNTYDVAPQVDDVFRDELLAAVDNGTIDDVVRRHLAALEASVPDVLDAAPIRLTWTGQEYTTSSKLTAAENAAVADYGGTAFLQVNDKLRGLPARVDLLSDADLERTIANIDSALAKSPLREDVEVWRAFSLTDATDENFAGQATLESFFGGDPSRNLTGFQWTDGAFQSTSTARTSAEAFGGDVLLRMKVPKGTQGISLSGAEGASEILLQRGLTLRVVKDHGTVPREWDGVPTRLLDVEVVPVKPLAKRTVAELRALAKEREITLPPKATKAKIVEALQAPPLTAAEKAAAEKKAIRDAARERNRQIEQATGTARLLAEVDELLVKKATAATIRQRLDPALIRAEQVFANADPAVREALAEALNSGDMAKVRAAVTRLTTKAKLKVVGGKAGAKVKFDPDTMESLGVEIADGASVTVVTRGASVTLPDGTVVQVRKAQVVPAEPPKPVIRSRSAAKLKTIQDTMSDVEAKAEFAKAIDGEYVGGIRAEVTAAHTDGFDDQWTTVVEGNLFDSKTGAEIGQFSRQINRDGRKWEAHHDVLEIDRDHQGSGFANDFNANLYDWYRRSGIKRVSLGANIDVGGYAWATKGFDFEDVHELRRFISQIEIRASDLRGAVRHTLVGDIQGWTETHFAQEFPGWTQAEFIKQVPLFEDLARRVKAGEQVSAYEISQLGRVRGQGRDDWWIGKALMFHSFWSGLMRL